MAVFYATFVSLPQAKTAQTVITGNVCFNLARAGFNFNDGLGGGDEVHNNVIFNSNRESADHGWVCWCSTAA